MAMLKTLIKFLSPRAIAVGMFFAARGELPKGVSIQICFRMEVS